MVAAQRESNAAQEKVNLAQISMREKVALQEIDASKSLQHGENEKLKLIIEARKPFESRKAITLYLVFVTILVLI